MSIKSDKWIQEMSEKNGMIEPFSKNQIRLDEDGNESLKEKIKQFGDFMTDSFVSISSKEEVNIDQLNQIILKHIDTSYNRVMEYTVY